MRIVHFTTGRINPYAAKVGLVNVIYWLALEQSRLGHEVSVAVVPQKKDYENIASTEFEIREYPSASLAGFYLPRQLISDLRSGRLKPDIAHLHGVYSPQMVKIAATLNSLGIPYVVSTHGSLSPQILRRGSVAQKLLFKRLFVHNYLRNASFIHVHAEGEVNHVRWYGIDRPVLVAEHGIDFSSLPKNPDPKWLEDRWPEHAGTFKLLFLGRLDVFHKGIDLLLEGFALVAGQIDDITLFLVGPPKRRYKDRVPKLLERLNVRDRVVLVGPIFDPFEKCSAIASSDLFVLTSRFEGFPLTIFEAMACGKPVLVTPGTNAFELVNKHNIGFIARQEPSSIAEQIMKAYGLRGALSELGKRAQEYVHGHSWRRTAEILIGGYLRYSLGQGSKFRGG